MDCETGDGTGRISTSSFIDTKGVNLDALNDKMNDHSRLDLWPARIKAAGDDILRWRRVAAQVLMTVTMELGKTELKDKAIPCPLPVDALKIIASFNEKKQEEWKTAIMNGMESGDWGALIKHPKLKRPREFNVGVPIQYKEAVIGAWNLTYHGNAHEVLLEAIDRLHKLSKERNYAKIIPITQLSGTGKSKTVDKIAMQRILFPLCLREDLGNDYFAYPPTDKQVRNYLDGALSTADEKKCNQYIRSFLSSLFFQARYLFSWDENEKLSYEVMAMAFYNYFSVPEQRNDFYDKVVKRAETGPPERVWSSFRELEHFLKNCCSDWPPTGTSCPVLLSIDEVHVLYTHRAKYNESNTLYSLMKSVFDEGASNAFAVISLSTAIRISRLAPSKEIAPSLRERSNDRTLLVPFTELPFNTFILVDPLVPNRDTLNSVGSLGFTAKFGRPLFYASYLSRKDHEDRIDLIDEIMCNVKEKLSGRTWSPVTQAVLDVSSIAILSARLHLELSPFSVHAKQYEEEGVRNHLWLIYSVHENQETIVTGSSSEPLVAEASAQIMHSVLDNNEPYMNLWDLLCTFVDRGLASEGAIGELIGCALSISAMDHAIMGLPIVCELKYQTPVTVADYYKALLTDEAWEALRRSTPANRAQLSKTSANKTFEDAFQDAYFHFSHYAKANDSSPLCDTCAWAYWLRGLAVVCQPNQELTDRMMPIYFSELGNVSPKTISVNLEQDKTGLSVNPRHASIQSAESLSIFSPGNVLPYIAAVHCYALTDDLGITAGEPLSRELRSPRYDKEAPRYQIDFRGLKAYRNITGSVGNTIRAMINRSKNSVFTNHTRDYGVDSVRQLLPVLGKEQAATRWFGGCPN
ncbi:hypothetical protein APHAL10511_003254 [Amanita phalloides]|nr:hypothetical protein APHAL10511_003254 [Amanita phalloides]